MNFHLAVGRPMGPVFAFALILELLVCAPATADDDDNFRTMPDTDGKEFVFLKISYFCCVQIVMHAPKSCSTGLGRPAGAAHCNP